MNKALEIAQQLINDSFGPGVAGDRRMLAEEVLALHEDIAAEREVRHAAEVRIMELEMYIGNLPCVGCEAPGLECSNCRTRREALEDR